MFERIVAGVNNTGTARTVADQAVALANHFGADMDIVCCFDPQDAKVRSVREHAEAFAQSVAGGVHGTAHTHVLPDDPAEAILDVARTADADLIIVGNVGVQGRRRLLGSVAKTVSQEAPCAVLILATS